MLSSPRPSLRSHFQRRAKRRGVLNQQPMPGGTSVMRRRSIKLHRTTCGNAFACSAASNAAHKSVSASFGSRCRMAARKSYGERADDFRQPAPVVRAEFAERENPPPTPAPPTRPARAPAVIVAAQADRLRRRREAIARAGRQCDLDLALACNLDLRQQLAEQIKLQIGNRQSAEPQAFSVSDCSFSTSVLTKTKHASLPSADSRSSA